MSGAGAGLSPANIRNMDTDSKEMRLLLVDDDRLGLAALARGLRDAAYAVVAADSGETALEYAGTTRFDLAVVDIRMPGMSGIETARRLRESHSLHSVFLTSYGEKELVEEAIRDGGLSYVIKPIDAQRLVPSLETALARARDLNALLDVKAQLERALSSGRCTSMVIGMLMERHGVSERAAFETLRAHARRERRKLEDMCREFVEDIERSGKRSSSLPA